MFVTLTRHRRIDGQWQPAGATVDVADGDGQRLIREGRATDGTGPAPKKKRAAKRTAAKKAAAPVTPPTDSLPPAGPPANTDGPDVGDSEGEHDGEDA